MKIFKISWRIIIIISIKVNKNKKKLFILKKLFYTFIRLK